MRRWDTLRPLWWEIAGAGCVILAGLGWTVVAILWRMP